MEWTKKQTMDLVELLHIHECLWNVKLEDYKDRQKKKEAVEAIARVMEISPIDTEKKITNLKNQYNRELNKIRTKSAYGSDDVYLSTWYAFKSLSFLKNHNFPRIYRGTEYKTEEESYEDHTQSFIPNSSLHIKEDLNHHNHQEQDEVEPNTSRDPFYMHEKGTTVKLRKGVKRRLPNPQGEESYEDHTQSFIPNSSLHIKEDLNHHNHQEQDEVEPNTSRDPLSMHETGTQAKRPKTNQQEELSIKETQDNKNLKDEFDIFGEYIASEIRGIRGVKNILDTKKEIQDLIYYRKLNQIMKHRINPQ